MTHTSLPMIIQLLKNNIDKWYTYQDIAKILDINVTNINKLVSVLVKNEIIEKQNTRPVKVKFNVNYRKGAYVFSFDEDGDPVDGCDDLQLNSECCQVEALVTVDKKGQIQLPKDLRIKENINEGDKFALVNVKGKGDLCCLILMKSRMFDPLVKDALEPVMKIIIKDGND